MKDKNCARCPGCSKCCPLSAPRCKYGRACMAKQLRAQKDKANAGDTKKKQHKWERHVQQGGPAWQLLQAAHCTKKALKKGRICESQLLAPLSDEDRLTLTALLSKLDFCGKKNCSGKNNV